MCVSHLRRCSYRRLHTSCCAKTLATGPQTIFVFTGWQLREAAGENAAQDDSQELSIPDSIDFAAESAQASDFDQEDPTEELAAAQELADLSAPLEQETDENSAAFQAADDSQEEEMDSDSSPGQLLERVERLLRWLKGCPHGAMSHTGSPMQLPESEQLQVTGSSELMPPTAEALPQQMSIVRPLRITMFLNGVLAGASLPKQAQQAPLMMQVAFLLFAGLTIHACMSLLGPWGIVTYV